MKRAPQPNKKDCVFTPGTKANGKGNETHKTQTNMRSYEVYIGPSLSLTIHVGRATTDAVPALPLQVLALAAAPNVRHIHRAEGEVSSAPKRERSKFARLSTKVFRQPPPGAPGDQPPHQRVSRQPVQDLRSEYHHHHHHHHHHPGETVIKLLLSFRCLV